jgi:hypothetical protein
VAADDGRRLDAEQLADVGPSELMVAGVLDDLGKEAVGLAPGVWREREPNSDVAEPVGPAQLAETLDSLLEDGRAMRVTATPDVRHNRGFLSSEISSQVTARSC